MDKIITINLGGQAIRIEEDAFEKLRNYIRRIEEAFAGHENGKEIISDIESRIAEMLLERTGGKIAAQDADIDFVIQSMGNPGDFDSASENEPAAARTSESIPKRLYRDPDNKVLGGVCSGISNYFNLDPVLVRVIWVVLFFFFGSGFLLYLILWVIVPEATTTAQKLEMRGEAPTFDNIINRVKTEAGRVEQNLKAQNFGQRIADVIRSLTPVFVYFFRIVAMLFGIAILITLPVIFIALMFGGGNFPDGDHGLSVHGFPNFFDASWEFLTFNVLALLIIGIPLFTLVTSLLKFAFNSKVNYRPVRKILGWVWLLCLPLLIYFIYIGIHNFRSYETVETEKSESVKGPLNIRASFNEEDDMFDDLRIRIEPSADSLLHVTIRQSASSRNKTMAMEMATRNGASYTLKDGELLLSKSDYFSKTGLFRRQKVEYILYVPEKVSFTIDRSAAKNGASASGLNTNYYNAEREEKPLGLVFIGKNLYCPSCPDSIPPGSYGLHNFKGFYNVEAEGWIDVEILKGDHFEVRKSGDESILEHVDIDQWDETLSVTLDDHYWNLRNKPAITIIMPELRRVKFSGATEGKVGRFAGNELIVEMNGASKAVFEAEYDHISVNLSGVSRLDLKGVVNTISSDISGASVLNTQNLTAETVKLDINGASEATVGPCKTLEGNATGASRVEYTGSPSLRMTSSGVSKVKALVQ